MKIRYLLICSLFLWTALPAQTQSAEHRQFLEEKVYPLADISKPAKRDRKGAALVREAGKIKGVDVSDVEAVIAYFVGTAYQENEDWKNAEKQFKKCLRIRKKRGDKLRYANQHLIEMYLLMKDYNNAEKYAKLDVESRPYYDPESYMLIYDRIIYDLIRDGKYEEAEKYFLKNIEKKQLSALYSWFDWSLFYRRIYRQQVEDKAATSDRRYWVDRWIETAKEYGGADVVRSVIGGMLIGAASKGHLLHYNQKLIDFEKSLGESPSLHYAYKQQCHLLVKNQFLVAAIEAYIDRLAYEKENKRGLAHRTLHGLNAVPSLIYNSKEISEAQGDAVVKRLEEWQKSLPVDADPAIKKWLDHNIAFTKNAIKQYR